MAEDHSAGEKRLTNMRTWDRILSNQRDGCVINRFGLIYVFLCMFMCVVVCCSNMKLLPYQLQLGHYVLERLGEGDDNMGNLSEARRLEEALRSFIGKGEVIASALTSSSQEAVPEETRRILSALEESVPMMLVVSLFFLTLSEWKKARAVFLRALLIRAGVMKVSTEGWEFYRAGAMCIWGA